MCRFMCALVVVTAGMAGAEEPKPVSLSFENDQIGAVPKGWTVAKTGTGDGSVWKVVEDKTAPKGTKVLAQTAESPNAVFNLCVADDTSWADGELRVALKAVEGKNDQGGGVVWRNQDANNYYIARYNPLEENFRVYKVVDGKRTQLASHEGLKAAAGEWHTLTITVTGDQMVCQFNGKKYLEAKDNTFAKAGKVGLWTKADARTYFSDFQYQKLTK